MAVAGTPGSFGILGYGRFGQALAGLLHGQGCHWHAYDPVAPVPVARVAASPQALADQAEVLIVAVPVSQFEPALQALRPHLRPRHLVIDVASVKQRPCEVMDAVLGRDIAHVGAHPLFGPLSIARAEPLRTLICPSPLHPSAADRAEALFIALGSEVARQTPEAHDRFMALTHAMAFFIAKGLLDLGVGEDLRWAPPSFGALAASIAAVRADAGHLFRAIQNDNPYAAQTRRQFIDALRGIDQRIGDSAASEPIAANVALAIPDLGQDSPVLREVREHIDELDRELVDLLRRRRELSARAAAATGELGTTAPDPACDAELMHERAQWAEAAGLAPWDVQALFRAILEMSRRSQG